MTFHRMIGLIAIFVVGAFFGAGVYRANLPRQIQWELDFYAIEGALALHRENFRPKGRAIRFASSLHSVDEENGLELVRPDTLMRFSKADIAEICLEEIHQASPNFFIAIRFTPDARKRLLKTLEGNQGERWSFRLGDTQLAHFYTDAEALKTYREDIEQNVPYYELSLYVDRDMLFDGFQVVHDLEWPEPPRACHPERNAFDIPHYREFVNAIWKDAPTVDSQ